MSQQVIDNNLASWTFSNFTAIATLFSGLAVCAIVLYIFSRSGSLMFLRDMMWNFFSGSSKFETPEYEKARIKLREIEHYRFEFNIPAQTFEHTKLAEKWISKHDFSHRDIARLRQYIVWKDFRNLHFKTGLFSTTRQCLIGAALILSLIIIAITPPLAGTKYLMVSLTDSPNTPSFYLSEYNAKFSILSDDYLTTSECGSASTLKKFLKPNLDESELSRICSLFNDPNYAQHIRTGLKEQRGFLLTIALIFTLTTFSLLVRFSRLYLARSLHAKLLNP